MVLSVQTPATFSVFVTSSSDDECMFTNTLQKSLHVCIKKLKQRQESWH